MAKLYGRKIKYAYIGQGEGKPVQKCLVLTEDEAEALKTDVASEIFAEIESKKMFLKDCVGNMGIVVLFKDIAELKKKYTEVDK